VPGDDDFDGSDRVRVANEHARRERSQGVGRGGSSGSIRRGRFAPQGWFAATCTAAIKVLLRIGRTAARGNVEIDKDPVVIGHSPSGLVPDRNLSEFG
jgi:hypothetical protein